MFRKLAQKCVEPLRERRADEKLDRSVERDGERDQNDDRNSLATGAIEEAQRRGRSRIERRFS
ncbi:MAG TPA: hypothetical protein VF925_13110 [Casimicrobiaceae bacterium]